LPLLERVRVEVYLPDLPTTVYQNLLAAFDQEFTYSFGRCTIARGLLGSYLSLSGIKTPDHINLIYTDLPLALPTRFQRVARYADELKRAAFDALSEEVVMVMQRRFIMPRDASLAAPTSYPTGH
jgi:hypothetical protein